MDELSERQKFLLGLVIHEYIRTAQPVGSKCLVAQYNLDLSSATVRNELAALTEMTYLRQPHTSAGRLPTEKGYRLFVSNLMQTQDISEEKRRMIEHQFSQAQQGVEGWMKLAASILANHSKAASLVSAPLPQRMTFKSVALIPLTGKQILMVMVLAGGQMQQRFLFLSEQVQTERLLEIANEINHKYHGLTCDQIHEKADLTSIQDSTRETILRNMVNALFEVDAQKTGEVYTDGISNVLAEPEFVESEDARRSLSILDEQPILQSFLSKTESDQKVGGVQVFIGANGMLSDLHNCSMILARYGTPGIATGMIGILGPTRMAYSKNIPTVRFVAGLLSDLVSDSYTE